MVSCLTKKKSEITWTSVLEMFKQEDNQGLPMESDKHFCRAMEHYKNIGWVILLQFWCGKMRRDRTAAPGFALSTSIWTKVQFSPALCLTLDILVLFLRICLKSHTKRECWEDSFHVTFLRWVSGYIYFEAIWHSLEELNNSLLKLWGMAPCIHNRATFGSALAGEVRLQKIRFDAHLSSQ